MVNHHCCVVDCNASTRKFKNLTKYPCMNGVKFLIFPKALGERRAWLRLIRRENFGLDQVTRHTRICSRYWTTGEPTKEEPHPTVFPYKDTSQATSGRSSSVRQTAKRKLVFDDEERERSSGSGLDEQSYPFATEYAPSDIIYWPVDFIAHEEHVKTLDGTFIPVLTLIPREIWH